MRVFFVAFHMVTLASCVVTAGAQVHRRVNVGDVKTEEALVIGMNGRGRAPLWVYLRMRGREEKFPVSQEHFGRLRILDVVEVRSQRGVLGYDFVTDIVKVGSKRIAN